MIHALRWFPTPREVVSGVWNTRMLLALRWRMIRGVRGRLAVFLGAGLALAVMYVAASLGNLVRQIAIVSFDTAAGQFAVNYVLAAQRGELGAVGGFTFATALLASFLSPLTGSSNLSLASPADLSTLAPRRLHRYFDAFVIHLMSTIGVMQLVILTGLASLLTLNGGRLPALIVTWGVWIVLMLISTVVGWTIELLFRLYGRRTRVIMFAGFAVFVGILYLLWPEEASSLWGIGTVYLNMISPGQTVASVLTSLTVLAALSFVIIMAGMALSQKALSLPAPVEVIKHERRWTFKLSDNGTIALLQVLMRQTWRTTEVKRPLLTILLLAVPVVWFTRGSDVAMTTLVVAGPMAVGLAWAVNVFGIVGPGMTWLAAQPGVMRKLPYLTTAVGVILIVVVFVLAWIPPMFIGAVDPLTTLSVAAGTVVASAMTLRSAAAKSINRPYLIKLGNRGDTVVPPLTAVNYTLRFALWGGQLGVLAMSQTTLWIQWAWVGFFVLWAATRYYFLMRKWSDRTEQARVVAAVSAA